MPHTNKKKGELMENDQDAMEVCVLTLVSVCVCQQSVTKLLMDVPQIEVCMSESTCLCSQYSSEEEEVDLQTALTGFQTKQRKVLEPVDHKKIEYEPYRKNFYVEVPELAKMTPEGMLCRLMLAFCCSVSIVIGRHWYTCP